MEGLWRIGWHEIDPAWRDIPLGIIRDCRHFTNRCLLKSAREGNLPQRSVGIASSKIKRIFAEGFLRRNAVRLPTEGNSVPASRRATVDLVAQSFVRAKVNPLAIARPSWCGHFRNIGNELPRN